jgi:hypothetical protein
VARHSATGATSHNAASKELAHRRTSTVWRLFIQVNLAIRIDFGDQLVLSFEGAVVNLDSNEMWCFSTTQRSATLGELMRHGKELVFMGSNGSVMAVDVNGSGTAFQVGTPTQLSRFWATPAGTRPPMASGF